VNTGQLDWPAPMGSVGDHRSGGAKLKRSAPLESAATRVSVTTIILVVSARNCRPGREAEFADLGRIGSHGPWRRCPKVAPWSSMCR
jgi:hypothetical protein